MCGIVGIVSSDEFSVRDDLLGALARLEYRGYDSCGYAVARTANDFDDCDFLVEKEVGKISEFREKAYKRDATRGICHTRWATHGGVTRLNAHPHTNGNGTIVAVHNGIIENYGELRGRLEQYGAEFKTQTDSEVIPHYFEYKFNMGLTPEQAIQDFFKEVKGTYAVLLMVAEDDSLYAFKKDSPLVLGVGGANFMTMVASDQYAFGKNAYQAHFFEDETYAVLSVDKLQLFDKTGKPLTPDWAVVTVQEEETKGDYDHFMLKEINEQPHAAARIIESLTNDRQASTLESLAEQIKSANKIVFVACGSSYYASLLGASVISRLGYRVHNVIASEFHTFYEVDDQTLVFALSQSGETMDVVTVLKDAKAKGATIASLVNVSHSTIERLSYLSINILAGQEIAVASTKAMINQVIALLCLANKLGANINLDMVPSNIERTIQVNAPITKELSAQFAGHEHVFFLGRGFSYPIARELALKMKEISYIHAEGMMAGELKHGTIALIDPEINTPVVCMIPNNDPHMISSAQEVRARGASVFVISNTNGNFHLPPSEDVDFAVYAIVVGQLLAYYTALGKGCHIDQPRNIAKSVTVH